jgi:hypothetical protein
LFRVVCEAGAALPDDVGRLLASVKRELVVEALSPGGQVIERVPFEPESGEDLESYCLRVMGLFHWDRSHEQPRLKLRFSYL